MFSRLPNNYELYNIIKDGAEIEPLIFLRTITSLAVKEKYNICDFLNNREFKRKESKALADMVYTTIVRKRDSGALLYSEIADYSFSAAPVSKYNKDEKAFSLGEIYGELFTIYKDTKIVNRIIHKLI